MSGERDTKPGTLYVVSTPLGNLEDITLRAIRVLKEVDCIAAETMEHTRNLCRHFGIATKITSFNQHNQKSKAPELVAELITGRRVALVTNAGTPAVSDPGVFLVSEALKAGVKVSPVPGPSAVTAALSASGMRADTFLFCGFLSHRSGKRSKELEPLKSLPYTLVFFESPRRLVDMLKDVRDVLGDRPMVLHKEITKLFEEVAHGCVSSFLKRLEKEEIRGEYTLVVAGAEKKKTGPPVHEEVQEKIKDLLKTGSMSLKDVAHRIAEETGIEYRKAYRACLSTKRGLSSSRE